MADRRKIGATGRGRAADIKPGTGPVTLSAAEVPPVVPDSLRTADAESRPAFDVVAIVSSAGGVTALSRLLSMLPASYPAAVLIVQHLDPRHRSLLADILDRHSALPVSQAQSGRKVQAGIAYICPPNRHLLVNRDGLLELSDSELVHFVRPSADLLLESVAACYGDRAIAVVLTGTGVDGAMGVRAIKSTGGTVIVQDEETSEFFGMPDAAIKTGMVDFILPLDDIARALVTLVSRGAME